MRIWEVEEEGGGGGGGGPVCGVLLEEVGKGVDVEYVGLGGGAGGVEGLKEGGEERGGPGGG